MANTDPLSSQPISLVDWPHSPTHRLEKPGAYIVTSGTYQKQPFFQGPGHLTFLTNTLLRLAGTHGWMMQAWAVFPNHYHFIAESAESNTLQRLIRHLHSVTAIEINRHHGVPNRKVWFQYWESHLTFQRPYLARINYVQRNAVRHRIVKKASKYPWCSAGWFEREADRAFYKTVLSFRFDELDIPDDFEVPLECGGLPPLLRL